MEDISRTLCHEGRAIIGQRWDTINHVKQCIDNLEDFDLLTISLGRDEAKQWERLPFQAHVQ
jgi:hypothetical protein